jgi:tRNA pseudouridine13 synthase
MLDRAIHALAFAYGKPLHSGCLRSTPEDFRVTELPLLEPSGDGEHAWLWVRKRNENTDYVAGQLASHAGVHPRQVSYAGLKDRHAVTEQWFSVHLPGRAEPDWQTLNSDTITILRSARHSRKLQRGALRGNSFRITVRNVHGEKGLLEARLAQVRAQGVPNYFGAQRFGIEGGNLLRAEQLFGNPRMRLSRNRRSMALSAARSLLFNQLLSRRVQDGNWNGIMPGDAMQLAGSHSFFIAESIDEALLGRVAAQDIHPTGPLHGRGDPVVQGECRELEAAVLAGDELFRLGLEAAGLRQERRALRLPVPDLGWQWPQPDTLVLEFSLPSGSYATSVLRELLDDQSIM